MAHHKSAKKRIISNEKRRVQNKSYISMIKTFIKKIGFAISSGSKDDVKIAARKAESVIFKGVSKGRIHKNKAARKVSRLQKKVNKK